MGMFNYIKVEQDLPLNEELKALNIDFKQEEYQTKELEDNVMTTYIIRDYRLFELKTTGHWEDNPYYVKGETKFSEFFNGVHFFQFQNFFTNGVIIKDLRFLHLLYKNI